MEEPEKLKFTKRVIVSLVSAFVIGFYSCNYYLCDYKISSLKIEKLKEERYKKIYNIYAKKIDLLVYAYENGTTFSATKGHIDSLKNYVELYHAMSDSYKLKEKQIETTIKAYKDAKNNPLNWFF